MYQDCFYINETNSTLDQDQLLLQASYYPAANVGHLYFNLPTNQGLDLAIDTTLSSPYTDSTTWSSCSSSPSLDFENVFNFNLQQNDIESFLLSDLPNEISLEAHQKHQYEQHQHQHLQEQNQQQRQLKAFPCSACTRSFARKHDLQRHIRVHTGAKPYSCLNCTKAFARTDALKRHLRMEETCRMSPVIQAMKNTGSRRYRNL
ncbi:hypothetical protein [Parasitella parasitica]|uniref:C2H2-type domain-containing protein n=1 Tax=Parasitella parasitica TaxID=35722 RepID=A0A0B7MV61_9FUNG|nr:hypothetical protein [Parasitella parasitica]